jgi:O-acetyl-ADP-ribose deacetylase (regulator of RNase III)
MICLNGRVFVKTGDITVENTDVIVNAANSSLLGGGGVDGAIHRAAGPTLLEECRKVRQTSHPGGLPAGEAIITKAGNLKCKFVIHTVGPVYKTDITPEQTLYDCYFKSLTLLKNHRLKSIAFPAISTGVYAYPKEKAAKVSSKALLDFLKSDIDIEKVLLVFFSQKDADIFMKNSHFN